MAKLTPADIARLALSAGVNSSDVPRAVAIALAESGGDPNAYNGKGLDDSYGLWQINMRGEMGQDRLKRFGLGSKTELFTPSVNARAMAQISNKGKNWLDWTTYTRGTYLRHMPEAITATQDAIRNPGDMDSRAGIDVPGFGEQYDNLKKVLSTLTDKTTWMRVISFIIGFVLVMVALSKLTGDNRLNPMTKEAAKLILFRKVGK